MKRGNIRPVVNLFCGICLLGVSNQGIASAFQLWEQDAASIGHYHAGYAAIANSAATSWYNPAGIIRIKNQQFVLGLVGIKTNFTYKGNVGVTEISPTFDESGLSFPATTVTINSVKAQGGATDFVPNLYYVAPINDWIGLGLSVNVPFGLETNYHRSTALRYAATRTSISVINISPSLGFKINDKTSFGVGLDIQRAFAEFNSVAGLIDPTIFPPVPKTVLTEFDTTSTNKANDTAYGFHLGFLYEFNPCTRIGLSYHSRVLHHFTGTSEFQGPLAEEFNGGTLKTGRAKTNVILPPYTALSIYHEINPSWAFMASAIYTQWSVFNILRLNQVAGLINGPPESEGLPPTIQTSSHIEVVVPEHYHNSWNLSLGADYSPIDNVILRGGIGYDQTPVKKAYRNVQLPDSDRYVLSFGGHYQVTKTIGLDFSWLHVFINSAKLNPPPQVMGAETVTTAGNVKGGAEVFAGQVTWDII